MQINELHSEEIIFNTSFTDFGRLEGNLFQKNQFTSYLSKPDARLPENQTFFNNFWSKAARNFLRQATSCAGLGNVRRMFKIQNWPNRKFSRSVDGNFGKFDPKLDVLGSREPSFDLLIYTLNCWKQSIRSLVVSTFR